MGLDANAVARVTGITVEHVDIRGEPVQMLPQQVGVVGQGTDLASYALDPVTTAKSKVVGDTFGYGSPLHMSAKKIFPDNNDGIGLVPVTFYPTTALGGATVAAGDVTITGVTQSGAAEYTLNISTYLVKFIVPDGDDPTAAAAIMIAAINAVIDVPVIAVAGAAGIADIDCKFGGITGNDVKMSLSGPTQGLTFAVTQLAGGLGTSDDIPTALALVGDKWETMFVNTYGLDTTAFDAFDAWNEGRWNALVKKPAMAITGTNIPKAAVDAITANRKLDRTNLIFNLENSLSHPAQFAGRIVARMARRANNSPARDSCKMRLQGIDPATVSDRSDYAQRQSQVANGTATLQYGNGVLEIGNAITTWRPDGETPPAYQHAVDIVKLQNLLFNIDLIFEDEGWVGAPLIKDEDPTTDPFARKPKHAIADINAMLRGLGLKSIVADVKAAQERTTAVVDAGNPKRLNVTVTTAISGNAHVFDVTLAWAFLFGEEAILE